MANQQKKVEDYEPPKVCTTCGNKMDLKDNILRCPYCEIDPNDFSKPKPGGNPPSKPNKS